MSKRMLAWTQAKFEQYLKSGRGQGTGSNYKPWLTAQDFPTKGRLTRAPGWKSGRLHHMFSDHETRYFFLLEWSDFVVDIREQFPLIDVAVARRIAQPLFDKELKKKQYISQLETTIITIILRLHMGKIWNSF